MESRTQGLRPRPRTQKKIRGQGQGQPFRGQTLWRPRPRTKDTSASALQKKKKKVFTKVFQAISTNFNNSKNNAVLEGQGLDLRGQGQGLQNVSSRTPRLPLSDGFTNTRH